MTVFYDSACNASILQSFWFWVMLAPVRVLVYNNLCFDMQATHKTGSSACNVLLSSFLQYNLCFDMQATHKTGSSACSVLLSSFLQSRCKHRSTEFLTTQTDQSKHDILIDLCSKCIFSNKKSRHKRSWQKLHKKEDLSCFGTVECRT